MQARTTTTEVNGVSYQLRRMTPAVGSYIWQRLMAAAFKAAQQAGEAAMQTAESEDPNTPQPSPADRLRSLCAVAYMQLEFKDHEFMQTACMKVISRVETIGDVESAIPIMQQDGTWAAPDIADNPFLVTKLMTEAIVFNLASFLAESSPASS